MSERERSFFVKVTIAPKDETVEFATDPDCSCPVARYVSENNETAEDWASRQVIRNADLTEELRRWLVDEDVSRSWDNLWVVTNVTHPGA